MNILITGAFGFVGTNLALALKNQINHYLIAVDIHNPANHIFDEYYSWNNLEQLNLTRIDVAIHLAGKAHDTKNQTEATSYFEINTGLTQKIYDWFLKSNARKFIFFSSVKAAADTVEDKILTEDVLPVPVGPYGESKRAAEEYILQNLPEDKQVYILRPCMIHGPGNKGNLNLLYKIVSKRIPWPLGSFENSRSFCSIDNLSFIIQKLINSNIDSGIYHIADDETISTNELINLIASSQNHKAKIWNIPRKFIYLFAKIGDLLHFPLNNERLKKLTESYVVSNEKIKKALGIKKMPLSALEGFKKTFESFQK